MSVVFDTRAILALYLDEKGGDRVAKLLVDVRDGKIHGYMNIVNMTELFYILQRKSGALAEEKERNIKSYKVKIVPVDSRSNLWREAALIKSENSLSLADAFAAATAISLKSRLVTSDKEFDKIGKKLALEKI